MLFLSIDKNTNAFTRSFSSSFPVPLFSVRNITTRIWCRLDNLKYWTTFDHFLIISFVKATVYSYHLFSCAWNFGIAMYIYIVVADYDGLLSIALFILLIFKMIALSVSITKSGRYMFLYSKHYSPIWRTT